MRAWITRTAFVVALAAAGAALGPASGLGAMTGALAGLVAGVLGATLDIVLARIATARVLGAALGLAAGLVIAVLVRAALTDAVPLRVLPLAGVLLAASLAFAGAAVGFSRGISRLRQDEAAEASARANAAAAKTSPVSSRAVPAKLVDTSVIIDGRIADIIAAGFIEGAVVIPQFVLRELQQVADSSDPLKRNRGRKGLDVLRALQGSDRIRVEFTSEDAPEIRDVDAKLLWLAERRGARILTNDYNLNKVAQLHGIDVLNVNDLANAVRPVVLPGEPLNIQVIKEGKERNQGVGYLDDGTMVVVENGKRLLGQRLDVLVTSVIQTNAGKMIFATTEEDAAAEPRPRVLRRVQDPSSHRGSDGAASNGDHVVPPPTGATSRVGEG